MITRPILVTQSHTRTLIFPIHVFLDVTSPAITCPKDIITVADEGEGTAQVAWEIPEADDNSRHAPSVRVIPAILPPRHFPIGTTKIKYIAEDMSRNKAYCVFAITVKGGVKRKILTEIILLFKFNNPGDSDG
jgi:hypothetical protein